ncbi:hypothetical protein [uncultured Draconibacterium sp.]|uniref:hypothetical protein n=1 Tax=uncultured Draconibacterium sp. TaxID=1573823 RepID=UPI003217F043
MNEILNNKTGLPETRVNEKPMLKLLNLGRLGKVNSGRLIFADGQMFMMGKNELHMFQWFEFTKIKQEGMEHLQQIIRNDFFTLSEESLPRMSTNSLFWQANLDGRSKDYIVSSGFYTKLPSAFQKIEDSINTFMYRLNEKIAD